MYVFPFFRIRYIKTITINTHIDCANNSKCSVRDILLATNQGAFESVFGTFSVILNPSYTPGSEPEEQELFEAKQTFMFIVFNAKLQTDMGKTIVRRYLANTDAQSVWKELSEHMRTTSKGATEKRRLTQYVTNTVLDDNFKGTTE